MRLEVTRRADLAARALVALDAAGGRVKSAELASLLGTTAGFVPQVLAPLVERSWVRSEVGRAGGYVLAVPLDSLSLLEVIETIDGPTDGGRCVVEDRACDGAAACILHRPWQRARASLVGELRATPLSALRAGAPMPVEVRR